MPFSLECERCGACCRWPGEVRVDALEISKLAGFKGISEQEFIQEHTRLRLDRLGLALKERADCSCIFLEGGSCAVHPVKPQQCRDFPNRWVNFLWGKTPLESIRKEYPMLFNCSAFQEFLKSNQA
jgi:uncharacterized protein